MTADLHASTYLVDGVDLAATGVWPAHDGAGLWAGVAEELSVIIAPGFDGGQIGGGVFRPFTLSTMYVVRGVGFDAVWARIRELRRRCKPGRTVTLTRQMPDPEGTDTNVNHTTTARRQTDRIQWLGADAAVVDIDWLIADTPWHGAAVSIGSAAGTHDVDGDLPTQRMTITLPAGAARTVTNVTNGHWFTFTTGTPAGGTLVEVEARTAKNITGGADVSQYLEWGKTHPFRLDPGSNVITVSAATASISYQPAYQ